MSSQEKKNKEKGKEIVTFEENTSTSVHDHHKEKVSMVLSEEEIESLLQSNKEEHFEKSKKLVCIEKGESSSSKSKITPSIFYTSDEKARLRWTSDLHECFVHAVQKLGGSNKATPKTVKEKMEVEGIALHHVKSHLQKFRLGKCNIRGGTNRYLRRFRTARHIKRYASINSPRPQVNIKHKSVRAAKPKPKKQKEVQGSLYMQIENDLRLQRCREAQRMQEAFAIESQRKMFETQHFKASTIPTLPSQHNNYMSESSSALQQPSSRTQEQWFIPFSYHVSEGETNPFIPQNITSVEDFCNNGMACLSLSDFTQNTSINAFPMYEPSSIYPTQGSLQFNESHNYNMAQGFINPYMIFESQSMPGLSTITTQQQLQLNDIGCVIHNSIIHQGTLNNTILNPTTPQPMPASVPEHTYSSYPPYNTLEVVKAQLDALQNASTSQTQETKLPRETNVSSSVARDEVDPVDTYIDWARVKGMDIELDPVEVLEAFGFGVSP